MSSSQIETYTLSPWAKAKGLAHCFVYHGPSMTPTFQNGDFLFLRSDGQKLGKGDVIVFTDPVKKEIIVHRIISITKEDVFTRGDHNRLPDALPVKLEQIIGKVEFVENKRGIKTVANGFWGLCLARIWHTFFGADRLVRRIFWMPYNFIRERRVAVYFWRPQISKIQVQSEYGRQVKYLYKNRTVATWDSTRRRFDCRKPFDLVIPSPLEDKLSPTHAKLD